MKIGYIPIISLLLVFVLSIVGCSKSQTERQLELADTLIEEKPDSAYFILQQITPEELTNDKERAKYGLLHTYSLLKLQIPVKSDSLIRFANEYYSKERNNYETMRASWIYGRIQYYKEDYSKAMLSVLLSLDLANQLENDYWKGKAYDLRGDIYSQTYHFDKAVQDYKMSSLYYDKESHPLHHEYALVSYASSLINVGLFEEGARIMDSIKYNLNDEGDKKSLIPYINHVFLYKYQLEGNWDKVNQMSDSLLNDTINFPLQPEDYSRFALIALQKGDIANAEYLINRGEESSKNTYNKIGLMQARRSLAEIKGNYKEALRLGDSILYNLNEVTRERLTESPLSAGLDYSDKRVREENDKKRRMGDAIIIGSIIFLIIILAVIIINRQRIKIKLYQIQALLDELEIKDSEKRTLRTEIVGLTKKLELRDKEAESMKETQRSIEELKINVRQLFRSKWETVNIISSELYVQPTNQIHYNAIINKLKKQIERFKSTSYKQELEKEVDKHLDGIVSRLRKECVFLNEKHIEFLILNYSGFSVKTICLILDIGEKTFYSRRSRIRDKILKSDLSDKNIFLKYIQ